MKDIKIKKSNSKELEKLRDEVSELNQIINSIKSGGIDAFVVKNTKGEQSISTLEGEDQPYRVLIENLSEGAISVNRDGEIIHCNKQFSKLLNIPNKEILSSSLFDYIPKSQHEKIREILKKINIFNLREEFSLLTKKNNIKTVLLSCNSMMFGKVNGISIIITDITNISDEHIKLIHAQKELIKNEELFLQFTENINDIFWRMTPEMDKITYISRAYEKIFKKSRKTLYKNPFEWVDLVADADKENVALFYKKLRAQEPASVECRITTPEGEKKLSSLKGSLCKI